MLPVLLFASSSLLLPAPRMSSSLRRPAPCMAVASDLETSRTFTELAPVEGRTLMKAWHDAEEHAPPVFAKADRATLGLVSDADDGASTLSLIEVKQGCWSVMALSVKSDNVPGKSSGGGHKCQWECRLCDGPQG